MPTPSPPHTRRSGFSLVELVVVMLIMSILTGVALPRVTQYQRKARDTRRMADMTVVVDAIEQYKLDKGVYPAAKTNASYGGWDVSHDGDFIPVLVQEGYLREPLRDPINDSTYHLRYYVYPKGSSGCVGTGPFYVLGIRNFETDTARTANQGNWSCSGRDWGSEFAFVTGGGASYK
jgi:prepilin-type N-terminal cleavage/methylation domain-containing protein